MSKPMRSRKQIHLEILALIKNRTFIKGRMTGILPLIKVLLESNVTQDHILGGYLHFGHFRQ